MTGSYHDQARYKKAHDSATRIARFAKHNFESKLAQYVADDPMAFYRYVPSKVKTEDLVGPLIDENGRQIQDDNVNARLLL